MDRKQFPYWRREPLRFLDVDAQGHVNNLRIAEIAENSRAFFMREIVVPRIDADQQMLVSVKLVLELQREVFYPGELDIGTGLQKLGKSSMEIAQGVFIPDGCAATLSVVLVLVSKESRRPTPLPESVREAFAPWVLPS
jgi:acyl-CoA thioester hydrolase